MKSSKIDRIILKEPFKNDVAKISAIFEPPPYENLSH